MKQPLNKLVLSPKYLALLQHILQENAPTCEVWAYGSRVNDDGHSGSDLDLVIHHCNTEQFLTLQTALQESLLPMLIDLHRWEMLPDSFKQNIQQRYIVIQ
ncbi:nucleotidyltransferase family protein [Ursidibacter arcticus]